jgi:hypothetical protein
MTVESLELLSARLALDTGFDQMRELERVRTGITPTPPICSFCGRGSNEVRRMLAGFHSAYICSECVMLAHGILSKDSSLAPPRG